MDMLNMMTLHIPTFMPTKPTASTTKGGRCFAIKEGSIAWQIMAFFIRNPDEELTSRDAATKADTAPFNVETALAACVRDGYLNAAPHPGPPRSHRDQILYSAGPKLAAAAAHMHSINASIPRVVVRSPGTAAQQ